MPIEGICARRRPTIDAMCPDVSRHLRVSFSVNGELQLPLGCFVDRTHFTIEQTRARDAQDACRGKRGESQLPFADLI